MKRKPEVRPRKHRVYFNNGPVIQLRITGLFHSTKNDINFSLSVNCRSDPYQCASVCYLLAKKYDARAEICEALSGQPLKKIVKGRHVEFSDGKWRKKGDKHYTWIYTLKAPVVPGDILLVDTSAGPDFICVDRIDYTAGTDFCSKYKKVKKHMNMHMEEEEDINYEK